MSLPQLSRLLNFEQFPQELQFKEGANLFSQVFYKNHIPNGNKSGSVQAHLITLVSETELSLDIAGSLGMKLIFLPGANTTSTSELNLSLHFVWKLKDLVQINSISSFEFNSNGFMNLFQELYSFSNSELLQNLLSSNRINSATPLDTLIQDINSNYTPFPLIFKYSGASPDVFEDLLIQLETSGLNLTSIVFSDYIFDSNVENTIQNLKQVFSNTVNISKEKLFDFLLPKINFSVLQLPVAIEFPDSIFKPVDASNNPIPNAKTRLTFDIGRLDWSSVLGFSFQQESSFSFTKSEILNTGFTLEINQMKLDLSRKNNIPEAIADNRPDDFMGVYITQGSIGFPSFLNHDDTNSTAELFVNNLLVGTGGLSGTIGLKLKNGQSGTPKIKVKIGDFELEINIFSLTFRQNAIVGSDVRAKMKLPWFKDENDESFKLDVLVHFEQNGEFNITAIPELPIRALKQDGVFTLSINSFSVGSKNDRYFIKVSGDLSFENINSSVGNFLSSAVSVKELIIWDDGKIEFKGGFNPLPKSVNLQLGPAKISVTNIHLGQDQRTFNGELINYNFFGFDAALSLDPGGLDLRGDGIKLYYAFDPSDGRYIDAFMRIQGINIDLYIPASVSRERASVIIKGYLRLKNDPNGNEEYQGGIDFSMPDKGIAASAAMAYKPKVPSFLVDASLTLATPLV